LQPEAHAAAYKSGKSRHVALTGEGRAFFDHMAAGKVGSALLFQRDGTLKDSVATFSIGRNSI
jgi:hypothetical protein